MGGRYRLAFRVGLPTLPIIWTIKKPISNGQSFETSRASPIISWYTFFGKRRHNWNESCMSHNRCRKSFKNKVSMISPRIIWTRTNLSTVEQIYQPSRSASISGWSKNMSRVGRNFFEIFFFFRNFPNENLICHPTMMSGNSLAYHIWIFTEIKKTSEE